MKVLLAIDDSDFSKAAIRLLQSKFNPRQTEVHVLHAVEPLRLAPRSVGTGVGPSVPGDFVGLVEEWLDRAEALTAEAAKSLEFAGFAVTSSVVEGDAKHEILEFAGQWKPELIVLGSHGRTGFRRFLLGSVSEAVARHADCSVLIVRPAPPAPLPEPSPAS